MRLTLRTILAYVDDQLEPIQAREIGARIAESKEALELVARIREVIRRRRTGAPELAGPGSGPDPNLVADYLENVLPPAQVYELERLCQSSDMHLAEIAGCHKILTMVLGQPLEIPEQTRHRMYALGSRKVHAPVAVNEVNPPPPMTDGIGLPVKEGSLGIPEYLKGPRPSRFWPMTLIVLIGGAWCTLIAMDPSLWPSEAQLANPAVSDVPAEVDLEVNVVESSLPDSAPAAPGKASVTPVPPGEAGQQGGQQAAAAGTRMSINPAPPQDMPEVPPEAALPGTSARTSPGPATVPGNAADMEEAPPLAKPGVPVLYRSGEGVLLQLAPRKSEWQVAAIGASLRVQEEFASPIPFRATLTINPDLELIMEPGARLKRLADRDDQTVSLALDRGRFILHRPRTSEQEPSLVLQVMGRTWELTLLDPGTRCGVELSLPEPTGLPTPELKLATEGGLSIASGRIRVNSPPQQPLEISETGSYGAWPVGGRPMAVQTGTAVPLWLLPEGTFVSPASKNMARFFEKEFLSDANVVRGIGPVIKDRRATISELAAQTLVLLDEYQGLVPALAAEHGETRIAAIHGLRTWLPRGATHPALLQAELERHFPQPLIPAITRLLWGYGPADARDPEISKTLVTQLQDSDVVIRELAFYYVSELTGRRYDYLPMGPPAERRAAATRWEEHLKRNGGALLPRQP